VSCAETAEPIEMPFGMVSRVHGSTEACYMGCTLAQPGDYDRAVQIRRRCCLVSNYFDDWLFLIASFQCFVFTVGDLCLTVLRVTCRLNCQTPFTRYNRLSNRLYNPVWQPVERTDCSFNTVVKPVVKPVWQPVWQPVVSCKRGLTVKSRRDCCASLRSVQRRRSCTQSDRLGVPCRTQWRDAETAGPKVDGPTSQDKLHQSGLPSSSV